MISVTNEQLEKIKLLDVLLDSMSLEDLKKMSEASIVMSKLKGTNQSTDTIGRLITEHNSMYSDLKSLSIQLAVVQNDFQSLLRSLNQTVFTAPFNGEFNSLKSKYGTY